MAEERRGDREDRPGDASQSAAPPAAKKKKRSKASLLFLLLLLAVGGATGLHFSGLWDARPLVWAVVPQLPYIGAPISKLFKIPEQYTLTVAERRAYELTEWQKRLDYRERDLSMRESTLDMISGDLAGRLAQDAPARQSVAQQPREPQNNEEDRLFRQLVNTMQEMSPRNAAQIVEQVRESLAVELLKKLPTDSRSSILAKMDPKKAARLTELMAISQ